MWQGQNTGWNGTRNYVFLSHTQTKKFAKNYNDTRSPFSPDREEGRFRERGLEGEVHQTEKRGGLGSGGWKARLC